MIESPDFGSIIKHNVTIEFGKATDLGTLTASRGRVPGDPGTKDDPPPIVLTLPDVH